VEQIMSNKNLDVPIWGARQIGKEAGVFKEDDSVDERKAFYLIESGYFGDAVRKVGRQHVSTPRKIRQAIFGAESA
jgi:hypothetical protein